jgi:hypothetical protein
MRPYLKKTHHKNGAGGVAQGVGPEFKPWYHKTTTTTKKVEGGKPPPFLVFTSCF